MSARARVMLGACLALAAPTLTACARRAVPAPAPEPAAYDAPQRGTPEARARLGRDDEVAILAALVRDFFRPSGGQARWIDPRPLGDVRDARADSLAEPDEAWAEAVRATASRGRVCVVGADESACRGREGGVLRFSRAYADGDARARVFARYLPARDEGDGPEAVRAGFEMVLTMVRRGEGWRIASERVVRAP